MVPVQEGLAISEVLAALRVEPRRAVPRERRPARLVSERAAQTPALIIRGRQGSSIHGIMN